MTEPLLAGVRIVEIADPLTEHAGRIFASLGAEVLLVEPPGGAVTRHRLPTLPNAPAHERAKSNRASIPFLARNANKHSLALDPADPADQAQLREVIARSDLVLDSDRSAYHQIVAGAPGDASRVTVTDEFGLGLSSIVGFAASGAMACSGWPGQPPVNAPSWHAADGAGIYAATMGAVALFVANRHGVRLDYEVPYHEGAIRTLATWSRHLHAAGVNVAGQGVNPGRLGDGPYPVIETADGYIKLALATPRQFAALLELCGNPPELSEGEWTDPAFRAANLDVYYMLCASYLSDRTTGELFHEGQRLGLTITPRYTLAQFRADPHAQARGLFIDVDDPDFGHLEMMRAPLITEPAAFTPSFVPAPALGSANHRLAEIIGEPIRTLQPTGFSVDPLRPLDDVRLLQLGSGAVVPEACMDFALLGADIVRVESMRNMDFLRRPGIGGDPDHSAVFNPLNLGVRSLTIDMTQHEATTIVQQLVLNTDAVVENMRAPVVENWGFSDAECRRLRPDVITLSSQGFGRGPYGHYQSFGPNLSAYCGTATQWAHPTDPVAVGTTVPHPDHVVGKQAFVALLAALRRRDRDGQGCAIEAAQIETAATLIADRFLAQHLGDGELAPLGNASLDVGPHGCYPCRSDQWIALACDTEAQWTALAGLIGESWTDDPAYATNRSRVAAAATLDARLAAWTADADIDHVESTLRAAGVPASRVVNADHMAAGPGNHPGGLFAEVDHPVAGRLATAGLPVLLPTGERPVVLPAPCMGQHTDEIVKELAGYAPEQIMDLRKKLVVGH